MDFLIFLIFFLIGLNIILYILKYKSINNNNTKFYTFYGKKNKYILTKNELSFFYKLKPITDKYNLYIFPKIRLADIIDTSNYNNFNKIKSKHIDFTICDKYCSPILFIELDDKSHNRYNNMENDTKKDYIMKQVNANLIRIKLNEIDYKLKYIESIILNDKKTGS